MRIEEMFSKRIDRDIQGVIKVGKDDEKSIVEELEEYVVTKELSKHFRDFFASYQRGIVGHTDKMGVWISGFFGSGKSHFLKILSYLLENREVDGKKAIDFFTDGQKLEDPMVVADIKLAENVSTDVILFNIDSKSETDWKTSKDAIINVFVKVFNEMQGFCGSIPFLADMERKLAEENQYGGFKSKFQEVSGNDWEESREEFYFIQDEIVDTLVSLQIMSEDAARNWCEKVNETYSISIEKFADMVRRYCESRGENHHVVFLVDEIGQYIADDKDLMLNLQTVTEDLGTSCGGKAWIVVTSQQDIDSIMSVKGNDFSKIQGRFDTRLSLSSANVDEVIRKRILDKTDTAKDTLRLLYDQKESIIKNLILFTDSVEKKLFDGRDDFSEVYPFVPYQINLLGKVLTAIRIHGASGKHLASGERSMIALFKDSAARVKDRIEGFLMPFNAFYDEIEKFIDHTHSVVIKQAGQNSRLEPFDVELLKVLFMVKYLNDELKPNAENLTTLMVSDIDEDRLELKKKVESSLYRLKDQSLIQKSGEFYTFLTNEEQDINKAIQNEVVEMGEIINEASVIVFQDIIEDQKYRYSARYNFPYNRIMDDRHFKGKQSENIGLHIITPYSDTEYTGEMLRMLSASEKNAIMHLPNDSAFLDEIKEAIKIRKYMNRQGGGTANAFESIKRAKQDELAEKKKRIKIYIEESLKHAEIYVNGERANINAKDPAGRANEALGKLVSKIYNKLSYMETSPTVVDIENMLKKGDQLQLGSLDEKLANRLALEDVLGAIELSSLRHTKTSLKGLMERFSAPPHGFVEQDIQWLVAALFKQGRISLTLNSKNISLLDTEVKELVKYLTKREYTDKLLLEKRERATEKQIKSVKEVMKDVFGMTSVGDEEDSLMKSFKSKAEDKHRDMEKLLVEYRINSRFPGEETLKGAKKLLGEILEISNSVEFFNCIDANRDELLDMGEDIEPVVDFFGGEQNRIVKRAWKYIDVFEASKNYITDGELPEIVENIKQIVGKKSPYAEIHKLPSMLDDFMYRHVELLEAESAPISQAIESDQTAVLDYLEEKELDKVFKEKFPSKFVELRDKLAKSEKIVDVKNIRYESEALRDNCIKEAKAYEDSLKKTIPPSDPVVGEDDPPVIYKPKEREVILKNIAREKRHRIETEEDIDRLLSSLRKALLDELNKDSDSKINLTL